MTGIINCPHKEFYHKSARPLVMSATFLKFGYLVIGISSSHVHVVTFYRLWTLHRYPLSLSSVISLHSFNRLIDKGGCDKVDRALVLPHDSPYLTIEQGF